VLPKPLVHKAPTWRRLFLQNSQTAPICSSSHATTTLSLSFKLIFHLLPWNSVARKKNSRALRPLNCEMGILHRDGFFFVYCGRNSFIGSGQIFDLLCLLSLKVLFVEPAGKFQAQRKAGSFSSAGDLSHFDWHVKCIFCILKNLRYNRTFLSFMLYIFMIKFVALIFSGAR